MSERLEKARQAEVDASIRAIESRLHLMNHEEALHGMELYGLPYQCYFDYLERPFNDTKNDPEQQPINPMYPKRWYPEDEIITLTIHDFDKAAVLSKCINATKGFSGYTDIYCMDTVKADIRERVLKRTEELRGWSLYDDNWKRYFLYYLQGYDFTTFTYFDFYGIPEDNAPDTLIDKYVRLQSEYDPTKHLKPVLRTDNKYSLYPFRIDWNKADTDEYNKLALQYNLLPVLEPDKRISELIEMTMM